MKELKNNLYFKIGTILSIVLLLLIPTAMIKELILERESTQKDAIQEVSSKWGEEQTIKGPFISLPYYRYVKEYSKEDKKEYMVKKTETIHILPSDLQINGTIQPEQRYRGIYEIVVYNSTVDVRGSFDALDLSAYDIPSNQIMWDKARLTVGISDLRGIETQVDLKWNKSQFNFSPGVMNTDVVSNGINAPVTLVNDDSTNYAFQFQLDLKGSQLLYFTPVGKTTDIRLTSSWQNPSFNGAFLPDSHSVSEQGFKAHWNVLNLNRNYPQMWRESSYSINQSAFGIDLILPVDNYQKSYRSIQYAILFVVFTFLVFFFIEIMNKVFIHPIQYILVGIALVVFYTLLLSISEHLAYNAAFVTSAIATLIVIAGYVKAILKSNQLVGLITGILTILYTFIFIIIQLQDLALLMGSIGIFIILVLVMYFSRKIDWYNIRINKEEEQTE